MKEGSRGRNEKRSAMGRKIWRDGDDTHRKRLQI